MKKEIIILIFLLIFKMSPAQNYKFGKVGIPELEEKQCPIDSTASAAVLYSERVTYIDLDLYYGIVLKDVYFKRIKIYNKEGAKYVNQNIQLYYNKDQKETLSKLTAFTYNLSDHHIVKTKLQKANIYKEKVSKYTEAVKFTMPNIKPGSVVEWTYTKSSPFLHSIDENVLQEDIPIKKVYAKFSFPGGFRFRYLTKGNAKYEVKQSTKKRLIKGNFFTTPSTWDVTETILEVTLNNVPALTVEPFSGNIENYRRGLKLELVSIHLPDYNKDYAITWNDVVKTSYNNPKFGKQLKKRSYLKKELGTLAKIMPDQKQRMYFILSYAKSKIKWNGNYGYLTDKGVVKAYKQGVGNVADVNLNLVNMLNEGGINAFPVLISTVKHGIALFPTLNGFNYIIAAVPTAKGYDLLDATEYNSNINILPERDLNFIGRLIEKNGNSKEINLFPLDYSTQYANVNAKFDGSEISGVMTKKMDGYLAYEYRNKVASKNKDEVKKFLEDQYNNIEILKYRISNLKKIDKNVSEVLQFSTDAYSETIGSKTYISPLLFLSLSKNPFQSEKRNFPIFFNFPRIIVKKINLQIPETYKIEHLPSNQIYQLSHNLGSYKYEIKQKNNNLEITSSYILNQPVIYAEYYKELKSYLDKIVKKQAERIILKKD